MRRHPAHRPNSNGQAHRRADRIIPVRAFRALREQGRSPRDESGSALILALLFLSAIGLLVGALVAWTGNNLSNAVSFQNSRSANYALYGATQVAIQNIRYSPMIPGGTLNASPPSNCWNAGLTPSGVANIDGVPMVDVWCSTVWNPTSSSTRVVTFSACIQSELQGGSTAWPAECAADPGLRTIVTFDDYSSDDPNISSSVCSTSCGAGMTVNSSTISPANPSVSVVTPATGPANTTTSVSVTGTGFVSGLTTVYLIPSDPTLGDLATQISGSSVNVQSPTALTFTAPPSTTVLTGGTDFYVVVQTPDGLSGQSTAATFNYTSVTPVVTSLTGTAGTTSGSAAGGSSITIKGSGFLCNPGNCNFTTGTGATTVTFVDSGYSQPATNYTVGPYQSNGTQTLTVATPPVSTVSSSGTAYTVVVKTSPGATATNQPTFTYEPLYPVVASVSPTSGGSGTSVTITGIGFINGQTTVQFVPTGSGSTLSATNVAVQSSTQLTATVPSGVGTNTYNVEVTTTSGGASGTSGAPTYTG